MAMLRDKRGRPVPYTIGGFAALLAQGPREGIPALPEGTLPLAPKPKPKRKGK